jgi:hypothetical protein
MPLITFSKKCVVFQAGMQSLCRMELSPGWNWTCRQDVAFHIQQAWSSDMSMVPLLVVNEYLDDR